MIRRNLILFVLAWCVPMAISSPAAAQYDIKDVWTGTNPVAVAVNPATNKIYVINQDDQTVGVIDGSSNTLVATIPVGNYPVSLAVNPLTNRIYVVNDNDDDLTVINGATNGTYTVPAGHYPWGIAVNTATNKIYVTDDTYDGKLTSIDCATNLTSSVAVRVYPEALAINPSTNRIYVANWGENTVSVVDIPSWTNIKTILVGHAPSILAVNAMTNMIYVANYTDGNISVINGSTNTVTATIPLNGATPEAMALNSVTNTLYVASDDETVTLISGTQKVGSIPINGYPKAIVANSVTNKIYIAEGSSELTMIDGANNTTTEIPIGIGGVAIAANLSLNRIYIANSNDNTVSVVGGVGASALQFVSLTPCRVVDTRHGGGGVLPAGSSRSFAVPQLGGCNVPSNAAAYSLNVTVVPHGALGYLTIWPSGEDQPVVSTMNSLDGRFKANAAIIPAGYQGAVSVYTSNATDVILDINGYFKAPAAQTYQFYPLSPCRVVDTRYGTGHLKGPYLIGGVERDFPVKESTCIPQLPSIKAYSFNFTVVPHTTGHQLGYLSVWPAGSQMPVVSTLNNPSGTVVANAGIVPVGINGAVAVYPDQDTDLVVDINGYFADPTPDGLSLYPMAPCRVLDTRKVGNGQPFSGQLTVDVVESMCATASSSSGYVFNATVVPQGVLGYLTLWPDIQQQPLASTLNALDGLITSNMAIVPTLNGYVDAFASGTTQLILDISAYFAP